MEIITGMLLFLQMIFLLKILQQNKKGLRQAKEQEERLKKIEKKIEELCMQNGKKQRETEDGEPDRVMKEEQKRRAAEQEKLLEEVLSEVFT